MEGGQLRLLFVAVLSVLSVACCWASVALQLNLIGSGAVVGYLKLLSLLSKDDGGRGKEQGKKGVGKGQWEGQSNILGEFYQSQKMYHSTPVNTSRVEYGI